MGTVAGAAHPNSGTVRPRLDEMVEGHNRLLEVVGRAEAIAVALAAPAATQGSPLTGTLSPPNR